jgi:hypothetical protein
MPRPLANGFSLSIESLDSEGRYRFTVERTIIPRADELPQVRHVPGQVAEMFIPPTDYEREANLTLRYFHAAGSLLIGINELDWKSSKEEWIAESDEERSMLQIPSVEWTMEDWPESSGMVNNFDLDDLCEDFVGWRDLTVPLILLRDGREAYRVQRFYEAFLYFYLYLEGMFANGKSDARKVKREFRQAVALRTAATQLIVNLQTPERAVHRPVLKSLLDEFGHSLSTDGLIDLVVDLRGTIFHYNRRGHRRTVNPTRPFDYRTPSFVLMSLATLTAALELFARAARPMPED